MEYGYGAMDVEIRLKTDIL